VIVQNNPKKGLYESNQNSLISKYSEMKANNIPKQKNATLVCRLSTIYIETPVS
jgi:hypothetical protein